MHKISISRGAARSLSAYLNMPGACTSLSEFHHAGELVTKELDAAADDIPSEIAQNKDMLKKLLDEQHPEFEISEGRREAIKAILTRLATAGRLSVMRYTNELIETFGLKPA